MDKFIHYFPFQNSSIPWNRLSGIPNTSGTPDIYGILRIPVNLEAFASQHFMYYRYLKYFVLLLILTSLALLAFLAPLTDIIDINANFGMTDMQITTGTNYINTTLGVPGINSTPEINVSFTHRIQISLLKRLASMQFQAYLNVYHYWRT